MGWNVLEDTTVYLRRGGDSISLTGLSISASRFSDKGSLASHAERQTAYKVPASRRNRVRRIFRLDKVILKGFE